MWRKKIHLQKDEFGLRKDLTVFGQKAVIPIELTYLDQGSQLLIVKYSLLGRN